MARSDQPLLSLIVPAYNAEAYLGRCLDSVTAVEQSVEVIVVDDGSTDRTGRLAQDYVDRRPWLRLVSQPNQGHGGAIETGLAQASGLYFRVVDADDWLETMAFRRLVQTLGQLTGPRAVDLVVTNFVYDKVGRRRPAVMRFGAALPAGRPLSWDQTRAFRPGRYMLMHALTYRTETLRRSGLRLPRHCFYVDNLYAFQPLSEVQSLFYLDVDLYHYVIGRADQSVRQEVMQARLDQQLAVNRAMLDQLSERGLPTGRQGQAMAHYLGIVYAISTVFLLLSGTAQDRSEKDRLWSDLSRRDPALHARLRRTWEGRLCHLPGPVGRRAVLAGYALARRLVGFN
ncbi:MAG: glycosyltransferase [Propionibacteriaceae bacterium]|jgi:glycosyltransferase involved in cell wall biosynthesis|nr:glycosyltransferase [Propionibacteriaceae bacterium]